MDTTSPVFSAVQKIIELFDFEKDVSVYSYRDCFDSLWGISGKSVENDGKIWCVVDGGETTFNWLPIGVWGRFYRSKYGIKAPKLVLIGKDPVLNPLPSKDTIYVPEFYTDEGLIRVSLESKDKDDFIVKFYKALQDLITLKEIIEGSVDKEKAEQELSADEQKVMAWQGMVYATLSSPAHRHAVSNEIAPMVLRDALSGLKEKAGDRSHFIEEFEKTLELKEEQKALFKFWEWASEFITLSTTVKTQKYKENVKLDSRMMKDVWDVWSNARYLLIDDQAKSHGYEHIVRCVLELMIGKNVKLESTLSYSNPEYILDNFDCLFLDLRLAEKDLNSRNYKDISGIKIAKEISVKDPSFPIIIFSSSQQREIDYFLAEHKNIITCFRKPGIAGSVESVNGNKALNDLLSAIKRAFEMLENRLVYKKMQEVPKKGILSYTSYDRKSKEISLNFPEKDKLKLFIQVFMDKRYDKAFDFPYSFFEDIYGGNSSELKFIHQIGITTGNNAIEIDNGTLSIKAEACKKNRYVPATKILCGTIDGIKLKDLRIEQWSGNNLNLNLRALHQFRNLASHGIRSFNEMRRDAVIILLMFLDILLGVKGEKCEYQELGDIALKEARQLSLIHPCLNEDTTGKYIKNLFASICYYGKNSTYKNMYMLVKEG